MTDEELTALLAMDINYNVLIPALIEANTRKDRAIAELTKRVAFLEDKALKKAGRPKTRFYVNGRELTDDYLIYLIDYDYFTIRELEKEVRAGKNQLRYSFLPDENHPRKMRPIAKRKFEDLEQAILAYYEEQEQLNNRRKITLRKFYPEWFQYKWQETNNSNYMKHIDGKWKRYYLDDEIIDKPIIDLTTLDLKN